MARVGRGIVYRVDGCNPVKIRLMKMTWPFDINGLPYRPNSDTRPSAYIIARRIRFRPATISTIRVSRRNLF
jgi:hypothetical protein